MSINKFNPVDFARIVKGFREGQGWTQGQMADFLTVNQGSVSRYEKGRGEPTASTILKVCDALGTTPNELLLGGEPKEQAPPALTVAFASNLDPRRDELPVFRAEDYIAVPLVSGYVAAGAPRWSEGEIVDWVTIHKSQINRRKNLVAFRVDKSEGRSMIPTIRPGDIVAIDRDARKETPNHRNVYLIRLDDGFSLKRVEVVDNRILIRSDNSEEYRPEIINLKLVDFAIIGRVVWLWRGM